MSNKGPTSLPDVIRALDTHAAEDKAAFAGMGKSINAVAKAQETLDKKQDEQIDKLNELLDQAQASAQERGRRIERDKQERLRKEQAEQRFKYLRYVWIPLVAILAHLLTKWFSK